MTERVEEIRRQREECKSRSYPVAPVWTGYDVDCLLAALAQAERERDELTVALTALLMDERVEQTMAREYVHFVVCNASRDEPVGNSGCSCPIGHRIRMLRSERDEARAEVERLKGLMERRADTQEMVNESVRTQYARAEQAEAALARVRAALEQIVNGYYHNCLAESWFVEARAALEGR